MLYTFVVATLGASASAFNGPMAARPSASRAAVSMDGSWRRSFDGRGSFAPGAGAPGTSAVTGGMSVPAACKFMEANPDEKNASFCGRKTVEKFSYCPLHLMIVFQPKGKKEDIVENDDEVPKFIEKKIKSA